MKNFSQRSLRLSGSILSEQLFQFYSDLFPEACVPFDLTETVRPVEIFQFILHTR